MISKLDQVLELLNQLHLPYALEKATRRKIKRLIEEIKEEHNDGNT